MAATQIDSAVDGLVASTVRGIAPRWAMELADNNPLLVKLAMPKGKRMPGESYKIPELHDGRTIVYPIIGEATPNVGALNSTRGIGNPGVATDDNETASEFQFRTYASQVSISHTQMVLNSGKAKVLSLLKGKIKKALISLRDDIGEDLYGATSAGTIDGLGDMLPVPAAANDAVAQIATGTYGQLDRSMETWWRHSGWKSGNTKLTSATLPGAMDAMLNALTLDGMTTTLIVCDNNLFALLQAATREEQRLIDSSMGALGFPMLTYNGIPVVNGGGLGGNCPANRMFFINTRGVHWCAHKGGNLVRLPPATEPGSYRTYHRFAAICNLACDSLRTQGVLDNS